MNKLIKRQLFVLIASMAGAIIGSQVMVHAATQSKVTVRYMMSTGGEITRRILRGPVGATYMAKTITFSKGDAKNFILKGPKKVTGTFKAKHQIVTFAYQVPRVSFSSQHGLNITRIKDGNDQLKSVEVVDGRYDFRLAARPKQRPILKLDGFGTVPSRRYTLASGAVRKVNGKVSYYVDHRGGLIVEQLSGKRLKLIQVNQQNGHVMVKSIKTETHAKQVARQFSIKSANVQKFNHFWAQLND